MSPAEMRLTPAMRYRIALSFPAEYDVRRSELAVFKDWDSGRFVVTAHPKRKGMETRAWRRFLFAYYRAAKTRAKSLWREKYRSGMPNHVEFQWAETCFASAIPYTGRVVLTGEERQLVADAEQYGDFTLDMLWLLVEGLGWRPGKPVPEDDPGWLAVWAEEEHCIGYYETVRRFLGMSEPPYISHRVEMPAAVRAAYAEQASCRLL